MSQKADEIDEWIRRQSDVAKRDAGQVYTDTLRDALPPGAAVTLKMKIDSTGANGEVKYGLTTENLRDAYKACDINVTSEIDKIVTKALNEQFKIGD